MSARTYFNTEVVAGLRKVADAIERGDLEASIAVLVTGDMGELSMVHSLGENCTSQIALAQLAIGQHILLNAVMPDGNATEG